MSDNKNFNKEDVLNWTKEISEDIKNDVEELIKFFDTDEKIQEKLNNLTTKINLTIGTSQSQVTLNNDINNTLTEVIKIVYENINPLTNFYKKVYNKFNGFKDINDENDFVEIMGIISAVSSEITQVIMDVVYGKIIPIYQTTGVLNNAQKQQGSKIIAN